MNRISKILLVVFICSVSLAASDDALEIYLLRDTVVDAQEIHLSDVSVLHGSKQMIEQAGKLVLGKLVRPGQDMVLDRETIYARLASIGIDSSNVKFLGAMNARVCRSEVVISTSEIVEYAKKAIAEYLKENDIAQAIASSRPSKVVVNGDKNGLKVVSIIESSGVRYVTVRVDFTINNETVDSRKVRFKFKYNANVAVATHNIDAGSLISEKDFRMKKTLSNSPSNFTVSPEGKVAKCRIAAGREMKSQMLANAQQAVVVKKNQMVEIRYETKVLFVSALGEALSDGRAGEIIKVANVKMDDRGRSIKGRVIAARVLSDGCVVPAY